MHFPLSIIAIDCFHSIYLPTKEREVQHWVMKGMEMFSGMEANSWETEDRVRKSLDLLSTFITALQLQFWNNDDFHQLRISSKKLWKRRWKKLCFEHISTCHSGRSYRWYIELRVWMEGRTEDVKDMEKPVPKAWLQSWIILIGKIRIGKRNKSDEAWDCLA